MRRWIRVPAVTGLVMVALLASAEKASAHPLGNFTINTYSGLVVEPSQLVVNYVLDMAEIPTYQERTAIDANEDGRITTAERATYAVRKAARLLHGVNASVNGRAVTLNVVSSSMRFRSGQAGLPILRLETVFAGRIPRSGALEYHEGNYAGHIGWREITAVGASGDVILRSSVPRTSVSDDLLHYPTALLSNPLDATAATVSFGPGVSGAGAAPVRSDASVGGARPGISGAAFARLATWSHVSFPVLLVALVLAMGFGAAHALLPGHGKTIMAATLLGAGGRTRQAVQVGVAVAFMHTATVLVLGVVATTLLRFAPEQVYPWLTLGTGLLVLGLGGTMFLTRYRASRAHRDNTHTHVDGHTHALPVSDWPLSRKGLVTLALAGGILPSPTALVVLVSTVGVQHRAAFGLALVVAFSVGLASALVGVGLLALRIRAFTFRRLTGRLASLLPVVSAAIVICVGLFLSAKGAMTV
jgi:ABC-type nickel/cobalt efflux system permease component RcnA